MNRVARYDAPRVDAPEQRSRLDLAYERAEEERRKAASGGPPEGALVRRDLVIHQLPSAGASDGTIERALAKADAEAKAAAQAGPPEGALVLRSRA